VRFPVVWPAMLSLSLGLGLAAAAVAEPPAVAQDEIDYLLTTMGASGCEFYRNGSWHGAKAAEAHIRAKYTMGAARNHIGTAEDFIDQAATKSSLTGLAYAVRCGQSPAISTNSWLHELLAQYRIARTPGALRAGRSAPNVQP